MASTVKCEAEHENEVDPLSTHNEHKLLDTKQEEYLMPVVMTEDEVRWCCTSRNCDVTRLFRYTPTGVKFIYMHIYID
jgi:hypothetical protein